MKFDVAACVFDVAPAFISNALLSDITCTSFPRSHSLSFFFLSKTYISYVASNLFEVCKMILDNKVIISMISHNYIFRLKFKMFV